MKNLSVFIVGLLLSCALFAQNMDNYIVMIVQPDSVIGMAFTVPENNTTIKVVCGTWDTTMILNVYPNTGYVQGHIAESDTLIIYGNIKELYCQYNFGNLTGLDPSHCPTVTDIKADRCDISELNTSNNPNLDYLCVWGCKLTSLDLSNNPKLNILWCDSNNFTTGAFDSMMCSLPDRTGLSAGDFGPVTSTTSTNNAAFKASNSQNARNKHWTVTYVNGANIATTGTYACGGAGLEDIEQTRATKDVITVYPNPAKENVNITSQENITKVELVNMLGEVVYSQQENDKNVSIDTRHLSTGNYFLITYTDNGKQTTKVVIE